MSRQGSPTSPPLKSEEDSAAADKAAVNEQLQDRAGQPCPATPATTTNGCSHPRPTP